MVVLRTVQLHAVIFLFELEIERCSVELELALAKEAAEELSSEAAEAAARKVMEEALKLGAEAAVRKVTEEELEEMKFSRFARAFVFPFLLQSPASTTLSVLGVSSVELRQV